MEVLNVKIMYFYGPFSMAMLNNQRVDDINYTCYMYMCIPAYIYINYIHIIVWIHMIANFKYAQTHVGPMLNRVVNDVQLESLGQCGRHMMAITRHGVNRTNMGPLMKCGDANSWADGVMCGWPDGRMMGTWMGWDWPISRPWLAVDGSRAASDLLDWGMVNIQICFLFIRD